MDVKEHICITEKEVRLWLINSFDSLDEIGWDGPVEILIGAAWGDDEFYYPSLVVPSGDHKEATQVDVEDKPFKEKGKAVTYAQRLYYSVTKDRHHIETNQSYGRRGGDTIERTS